MKDTTFTFRLREGCSEKKLNKIWSAITPTEIMESCKETGHCLLAFNGEELKTLQLFVRKTRQGNYTVYVSDFGQ